MLHRHAGFSAALFLLIHAVFDGVAAGQPGAQPAPQPPKEAPAPVEQPRTVTVNIVAFSEWGGKAHGSCSPVQVTAGSSGSANVRVGFFESEVGGTGTQWRSAGWTAALMAALLTDFDPRAMRVSFEYEGRVDGPSAGGLMTIGVLAAVRGDTPRADAAMTGAINPDGTIGPVGGIPHKIEGAAAKGMKLILIPAGIRFGRDGNSGENVELIEHGRKLGIEVRPVFDIYTAYEAITGAELPRSAPAKAPQISPIVQEQVLEKIHVWYERYAASLKAYRELPGKDKLSEEAIALFQKGVDILKHSDEMKQEGEFSATFWDRVYATSYGYMALELGRCRYTYATGGGYPGVVARLRNNDWLELDVQKMSIRMRTEKPRTLDQLSMYMSACDSFLESISLQMLAKAMLASLPARDSELARQTAVDAAQYQILAWVNLKLTGDYLDLSKVYAGAAIPANAPWSSTSDFLRHASDANTGVFEAVIIERYAKDLSISPEQFRLRVIAKDRGYALLQVAENKVIPRLREYFGDDEAYVYAFLASSIFTHTRSAAMLAKYYSLDVQMNKAGEVTAVSREKTLTEWLAFADDQSRRNIAVLRSTGADATTCAQMYEIARIKSGRGVSEKLEALGEYWSADLHAQVLRRIGGRTTPKP